MRTTPRPKAGVFAVRQAPILFNNLRASLVQQGGLKPYRPQRDYLKLISLGEQKAIADKAGLRFSGRAAWALKDRIDRKFMSKVKDLRPMPAPVLPWPRAAGLRQALGDKPACGGCGSKIGADVLRGGLGPAGLDGLRDDAAMLGKQVFSTDHLRALVEDPVTMTRIAAVHALGDVWAMGAQPQAATVTLILPRSSPELAQRSLREIMQSAQQIMTEAGAEIVGGHSSMGLEMTIGFSVIGHSTNSPIGLGGGRPGDHLILTKPIGTGVIMAADMQLCANGHDIGAALQSMSLLQGPAAKLLHKATAMTDVTGFGLAGHLSNICDASGCGAELVLDQIPLLPGALALAQRGIRSTLFPQNKALRPEFPDRPEVDLLFDPQTAGGLLAAVPGDAETLAASLQAQGFKAQVIGRLTDRPGQITLV